MKRVALILLVAVLAIPAEGRDDHVRPYVEGVAAADAGDWPVVVARMQQALAHESQEAKSIRTRSGSMPYVPHFWLGLALANQERWDDALAELTVSEKQGVIQNTAHYAQLRATRSRIEARNASASSSVGVEEARSSADLALQQAMAAQARATTAGASRLAEFRQASQKLQEALASRRDGTVAGYRKVADSASSATELFNAASSKAKTQPSSVPAQPRRSVPARPSPASEAKSPVVEPVDRVSEKETETEPSRKPVEAPAPEPVAVAGKQDVEPEPLVAPRNEPAPERPAPVDPAVEATRSRSLGRVDKAFRSMAAGDLSGSAEILSDILVEEPRSVRALVLRGYVHYLQGVLERQESMMIAAEEDFRAALAIDPSIRLDEASFSPKAVRYFERLKEGSRN